MTYNPLHSTKWHVLTRTLGRDLMQQEPVEVGEWQSQDVRDKPEMATRELMNVSFQMPVPNDMMTWQQELKPNLPWAEDHFQERVSTEPLNPPPSEAWWPFAQKQNADHKEGEIFSHTYPERMWPRFANVGNTRPNGREVFVPHNGIRYEYGDLYDVVNLLRRSPLTRQAYLPIWFPEDTGNKSNVRIPCTLGYHFITRGGRLHCIYYMRSCDFLRHFADDVYMAGRLLQWVAEQVNGDRGDFGIPEDHPGWSGQLGVGTLTMHITSLHIFEGDMPMMELTYAT